MEGRREGRGGKREEREKGREGDLLQGLRGGIDAPVYGSSLRPIFTGAQSALNVNTVIKVALSTVSLFMARVRSLTRSLSEVGV